VWPRRYGHRVSLFVRREMKPAKCVSGRLYEFLTMPGAMRLELLSTREALDPNAGVRSTEKWDRKVKPSTD